MCCYQYTGTGQEGDQVDRWGEECHSCLFIYCSCLGLAKEAIILSPHESLSQNSYNLEWTVQSRSPISEFEVSVREAGDTDWEVYEVTVDKPEVAGSEDTLGDWSLELTELQPGTLYQVTVATRNTFGITQPGQPFTFSTREPGRGVQ